MMMLMIRMRMTKVVVTMMMMVRVNLMVLVPRSYFAVTNSAFQVYLLVCLTASQASPLFLDEPTIENLVDDFWDYFFFIMIGLPLDPGTWLMAALLNPRIRLSVCLSVTKRPQTKGVLWHPSLAHYPSCHIDVGPLDF